MSKSIYQKYNPKGEIKMKKTIIILTKSRKCGNYCVAGIDCTTSEWVRLNNHRNKGGSVSDADLRTADGNVCGILDVVEVECLDNQQVPNSQPENVYMNPNVWVKKISHISWDDVVRRNIENRSDDEVLNGTTEIGYGSCPAEYINGQQNLRSLQFLHVKDLTLSTFQRYRMETRAKFSYKGNEYYWTVTDPEFESSESGTKYYGEAYLVVSRGEVFNGRYYFFVGKVIPCCDESRGYQVRAA